MSTSDQTEGVAIEPGAFTRIRSIAAWAFIAIAILGMAWVVLTWLE